MNTSKQEFLSAFLDDEAGEFERRRLLEELKKDDELGDTLSRYAFIGEAMRAGKGQPMGAGVSLLSRIQDELADEPAYQQVIAPLPSRKQAAPVRAWQWAGMGMAATVAAFAVGGMLFFQQPTPQMQAAMSPMPEAPVVEAEQVSEPASATPQAAGVNQVADAAAADARIRQVGRIDPQTRDILKQYVAQHVKYASTTAIAPSIRAISYANER